MNKEIINYNDLVKRNKHINNLKGNGFKIINKANRYKKLIAYSLIAMGVLTLPLPNGSLILIGFGLGMLGIRIDNLKRLYKLMIYKIKAKRN